MRLARDLADRLKTAHLAGAAPFGGTKGEARIVVTVLHRKLQGRAPEIAGAPVLS